MPDLGKLRNLSEDNMNFISGSQNEKKSIFSVQLDKNHAILSHHSRTDHAVMGCNIETGSLKLNVITEALMVLLGS